MIRNSFSHSFSSLFLYCADFCSILERADLLTVEMATAQRTRPRAAVGAPRRVAWQLKSA